MASPFIYKPAPNGEAYVLPALSHVEAQPPKAKGAGTPMVSWRNHQKSAPISTFFLKKNMAEFKVLILAPTRELAVQISDMVKAVITLSGNGSVFSGANDQTKMLERPGDWFLREW